MRFRTNSSSAIVKQKLIAPAALVLSYTFSIQYQAGSGYKTRTLAQHTHYHLPPASSKLSKSSSAKMEHASGTGRTCSKLQNPLQEACTSIIRGVVELDSVKPWLWTAAAGGFWFAELEF